MAFDRWQACETGFARNTKAVILTFVSCKGLYAVPNTDTAAALTGCHSKQAIPELLGRTLEACAMNTDNWQLFPGSLLAPAVKQTWQPLWALPKICTKTMITIL